MSAESWRRANQYPLAPDHWEAAWDLDSYTPTPQTPGPRMATVPRSNSFNPDALDSGRGLREPHWPLDGRRATTTPGSIGIRTAPSLVPEPGFTVPEDVNPWRARVTIPEPPSPSPQRFTSQWGMPVQPRSQDDSRLTQHEQKEVLKKLKKKIYNPSPKRFSRRVSLYYREQARAGASDTSMAGHGEDDDCKSCAICLEDFEPREEVSVTPCEHMFHEECIVPWAKSHGQCPVCRSVLYDRLRHQNQSSNNNNNNVRTLVDSDLLVEEIASVIRLMEEAIRGGRLGR